MSALLSNIVLQRGIFPGLVKLHGWVLAVAFGTFDPVGPMSFLARLGQAGVSDVFDVARYGVGDVSVLGVTIDVAFILLCVDADVGALLLDSKQKQTHYIYLPVKSCKSISIVSRY